MLLNGRLRAALVGSLVLSGSLAFAGNSSNYIHLLNGVDYFFLQPPTQGALRGIWRCFPGQDLVAPTLVTDPASPAIGTYAAKVSAIHMTLNSSAGYLFFFPTLSISTSDGACHFLQSSGSLNFGLVSTSGGPVVAGPLSDHGVPSSNLALQLVLQGTTFQNPSTGPNILAQFALTIDPIAGLPSTIPIPEGDSMTLWVAESTRQTGQGNRMYWTGSLDERNLCSGYSFMLSGNGNTALAFHSAWEWSMGIGTLDATMTPIITSTGGGPTSLNAHAGTSFSQPFDQGSGVRTVSLTGSTPFPATSTHGEFLGFAHYDENNAFGGSDKLIVLNLWGFDATGVASCSPSPTFTRLPTGGPGGPALSLQQNAPRVSARIDALVWTLLANSAWIASTTHRGMNGGSNVPWFPAGAGVSGSTGNTGGSVCPLPTTATLVGVELYMSGVSINAAGTAIEPLANSGHSHTNGGSLRFFP